MSFRTKRSPKNPLNVADPAAEQRRRTRKKYAGLALLLVAARFTPLDGTVDGVASLFARHPKPSSFETASVNDAAPPEADFSKPFQAGPGQMDKLAKKTGERVRTILAQQQGSDESGGGGPRREGGPASGKRSRDKEDDGEIKMGGTGLLDEAADVMKKEHPLAAAHPDDYLVICEAGCRSESERIVYQVSKTAAASLAIAQRRLELSAAAPEQAAKAEDTVVCVAGCYDREPARGYKRVEITPEAKNGVRLAQSGGGRRATLSNTAHAPAEAPALTEATALNGYERTFAAMSAALADERMQVAVRAVIEDAAPKSKRRAFPSTATTAAAPRPAASAPTAAPASPAVTVIAKVETPAASENTDAAPPVLASAPAAEKLADLHLLSTETRARTAKKRAMALTAYGARWRTTVLKLADQAPDDTPIVERRATWKKASSRVFDTTISTESGWDAVIAEAQ